MSTGAGGKRAGGVVVKVILIVFGLCLLWPSGAGAALFLKFDGINGASVEANHRYWSEISRFDWGVSFESPGGATGGGRAAVRADFADFSWEQDLDMSFPELFTNLATGKPIFDAKVDFTFGEGMLYFQMQFWNVRLTYLEIGGDSSSPPTFIGAFDYDRIYMKYYAYDPNGSWTI